MAAPSTLPSAIGCDSSAAIDIDRQGILSETKQAVATIPRCHARKDEILFRP